MPAGTRAAASARTGRRPVASVPPECSQQRLDPYRKSSVTTVGRHPGDPTAASHRWPEWRPPNRHAAREET